MKASLVTSMGRMAAHTGQRVTYDQILECEHEFAPDVDKLTFDGPAPLQADPDGKYPVPLPGLVVEGAEVEKGGATYSNLFSRSPAKDS